MYHSLYYSFDGFKDFEYKIEENLDDILEYLIEVNSPEDKLAYTREVENKYYSNTLDTYALYIFDFDFKDWLKDKYYKKATKVCAGYED